MGKTGTLWRESLRTSFQGRTIERKGSCERSSKIRLIAYHCLRMKVGLNGEPNRKRQFSVFFVPIKVLNLAAIFAR